MKISSNRLSKIILYSLFLLVLACCKSFVQVYNTTAIGLSVEDEFYVYETDSIKITYEFWSQKGLMTFSIFNKREVPLYVDWKKSSFISNSLKMNYWNDETKGVSTNTYGGYVYKGPLIKPGFALGETFGVSATSIVKVERITFIPPKANYFRSQFYILPIKHPDLGSGLIYNDVPRNDDTLIVTRIFKRIFSKENSPLIFRNFLTYSFTEDFKVESYVDNEFFVNQITEMDKKHFEYDFQMNSKKEYLDYAVHMGDKLVCIPYKKATSFFINIPLNYSITNGINNKK